MRERYFWAALGIITISWIANSLYAQSKQLSEPIFLDHYIETTMGDGVYVTFYYLANKDDRSYINNVRIGEVYGSPYGSYFHNGTQMYNAEFTHHVLRSVPIKFNTIDLDSTVTFNEMEVFYSDGSASTVSIGEVIIHPEGYFESDNPATLSQSTSSGSNDGRSWHTFQATEPLSIQKITTPFNVALEDRLNLSITGSQIQKDKKLDDIELPIHLDEGKHITVAMQLDKSSTGGPSNFFIHLSGTTAAGAPFTSYANYFSFPYLTQDDANRIIEEKLRRDSDE